MIGIPHATREQIKSSLEVSNVARLDTVIDAKNLAAAEIVEGWLHRDFVPVLSTRKFDFPSDAYSSPSWALDLDGNDLISVSQLRSGGVVLTSDQYILRRFDNKEETPYQYIEINLATGGAFGAGASWQQAIEVTGLWGTNNTNTSIVHGELAAGINDSVTTFVINPVNNVLNVGVGSLLLVDSERMVLRDRRMSDTGQNTTALLNEDQAHVTVGVADGSAFAYRETILIDAERMRITDIAGNNLIVDRAVDGTALAAHTTAADVYALRSFLAERHVAGTVAASHLAGADVYAHAFPDAVNAYNVAQAIVLMQLDASAHSSTSGVGDSFMNSNAGKALKQTRDDAWVKWARKGRTGAM